MHLNGYMTFDSHFSLPDYQKYLFSPSTWNTTLTWEFLISYFRNKRRFECLLFLHLLFLAPLAQNNSYANMVYLGVAHSGTLQ